MKKIIYLFLGALLFSSNVYAGDKVAVIVNSANTQELSISDVKNIYSDIVTTWESGESIAVYNLPLKSVDRGIFSREVLRMTSFSAETEINNLKITNRLKNPAKTKRDKLVLSVVSRNPDAIGYVSASLVENKTGIRVLFEFE